MSLPRARTSTWPKTRELAGRLQLEIFESCSHLQPEKALVQRIPLNFARSHHFVALGTSPGGFIRAVMADPLDVEALQNAQWLLRAHVIAAIAPLTEIEILIGRAYESSSDENARAQRADCQTSAPADRPPLDLGDVGEESPIIALLNATLREAIAQGASDVHVEPGRIRHRIDGQLQTRRSLPQIEQRGLVARIKILAGLDIAESRRPQDGSFSASWENRQFDVRVATMPVVLGERVAMRLLSADVQEWNLRDLQLPKGWSSEFRAHLLASQGLILVCGPTGCGKSTTLCAALAELPREEKNIASIEDPVEYRLPGISQTAVHPLIGLDFASGLRHLLRQDPDVIFIGELRDQQTAQIALRAALTGHLVLSTLHAARAPRAIDRLFDLGVEPSVVATCLRAVLAQRLVRTLCPHCKIARRASQAEVDQFPPLANCAVFEGRGCEDCRRIGYRGRRALFEWLPIDAQLSGVIAKGPSRWFGSNAPNRLHPFEQHALTLIQEGVTSVAEVQRNL